MSGIPRSSGFLRARQAGFDIADGVIAEATDQTTAEARQAGGRRGAKALHVLADEVERVGVVFAFGDAIAVENQYLMRIDDDPRRTGQADDRVAAKALAALHRFEQVGVGALASFR
jgi:D-serine deaminase-like pyridoxal phosphate-dependent protein